MVAEPGKFGFVTCGPFSGINDSLLPLLSEGFPALDPDLVDIPSWVRGERRLLMANVARALVGHWPRPALTRDRLWGDFYRTPYLFAHVRRLMASRAASQGYAFSFQTQSLFDASVDGIPHFVYTDHTGLAGRQNSEPAGKADMRHRAWLTREREIYARAATVFTMSSHVSRSVIADYDVAPQRVRCVYAGSNVTAQPGAEHPYGSQRILFVGRDWERKGGADLIAAFRVLRRQHPAATLRIVGCLPDLRDEAGVTILGELAPPEVREEFAQASVFCLPTLHEPFGLVFVEALTLGVPVVATEIGAVPEVVAHGETGYLVKPHDVPELAAALSSLLSDPSLARRFGQEGRTRMPQRYTWALAVGAMVDDIQRVLQEKPST